MKYALLALLALPFLTGCDKAPFDCVEVIPEGVAFEADPEFFEWVDRNQGVRYERTFWYASDGTTVGWSITEDSEVCVSEWSK